MRLFEKIQLREWYLPELLGLQPIQPQPEAEFPMGSHMEGAVVHSSEDFNIAIDHCYRLNENPVLVAGALFRVDFKEVFDGTVFKINFDRTWTEEADGHEHTVEVNALRLLNRTLTISPNRGCVFDGLYVYYPSVAEELHNQFKENYGEVLEHFENINERMDVR